MKRKPQSEGVRDAFARVCEQIELTRRTFVTMLLSTTSAVAVSPARAASDVTPESCQQIPPTARRAGRSLVRADDMLVLTLYLDNLRFAGNAPNRQIQRIDPTQPARLIFQHQPQAIEEWALVSDDPAPVDSALPSFLSGPSYVAFEMPGVMQAQPLGTSGSLQGLLEVCTNWPMSLDVVARLPNAIDPSLTRPHPPTDGVTAIELPYRLIQSPLPSAGWSHARSPVDHGGHRTELWHTRLGTRRRTRAGLSVQDNTIEPLRAIWSPDYPNGVEPPAPSHSALSAKTRSDLVRLTAGYNEDTNRHEMYTPTPSMAKRLMLSALGGWLDVDGHWDDRPAGVTLSGWTHRAAGARAYHVRTEHAGFLFPFGHAATYVELTERVFKRRSDSSRAAVLQKRAFLVVRERVRSFPRSGDNGLDFPFKAIEITTKRAEIAIETPGSPFWPRAGGDFEFQLVGVDAAGRRIPFSAPLKFIPVFGSAPTDYTLARSKRALGRAHVQLAPNSADGDTSFPVDWMMFGHKPYTPVDPAAEPTFLPTMASAFIGLPAVQHLMNQAASAEVAYDAQYLASGFASNNPAQVYLQVQGGPAEIGINRADPGGPNFAGMITPTIKARMLSRSHGPMDGSIANANAFDPRTLIPEIKLLGVIDLKEVLIGALGPNRLPKITSVETDDAIETRFHLESNNLTSWKAFRVQDGCGISINTVARVSKKTQQTKTTTAGTLSKFHLNLFDVFVLKFNELTFGTEGGVRVRMAEKPVDLQGVIGTLNDIMSNVPGGGFGDPPPIRITSTGVTVSAGLALPSIPAGAFNLMNVKVIGSLTLSFVGDAPVVEFDFSRRDDPFRLIILLIGGSGFVGVSIDSSGVRRLEANLGFAGELALDVIVAKVDGFVCGGLHYFWDDKVDQTGFGSYFVYGVTISLFDGLVSVGYRITAGLDFIPVGPQFRESYFLAHAEVSLEVGVAFATKTITFPFELKIQASKLDPLEAWDRVTSNGTLSKFADNSTRRLYCAAFA